MPLPYNRVPSQIVSTPAIDSFRTSPYMGRNALIGAMEGSPGGGGGSGASYMPAQPRATGPVSAAPINIMPMTPLQRGTFNRAQDANSAATFAENAPTERSATGGYNNVYPGMGMRAPAGPPAPGNVYPGMATGTGEVSPYAVPGRMSYTGDDGKQITRDSPARPATPLDQATLAARAAFVERKRNEANALTGNYYLNGQFADDANSRATLEAERGPSPREQLLMAQVEEHRQKVLEMKALLEGKVAGQDATNAVKQATAAGTGIKNQYLPEQTEANIARTKATTASTTAGIGQKQATTDATVAEKQAHTANLDAHTQNAAEVDKARIRSSDAKARRDRSRTYEPKPASVPAAIPAGGGVPATTQPSTQPAAAVPRGATAINRATGQRIQFDGTQWVPLQ